MQYYLPLVRFSPVAGTISNVFPTKHAVGITTASGVEVLLHMGLDTVDLGGKPFELYVQAGQHVGRGQMIAKVDLEAVKSRQENRYHRCSD